MNRVRFDMHCHTAEGSPDAKVKILDYIDLLKQRGFHGMLVTDHDSYSGYKAYLRQKDKVKDFTVLRGIEYDTFDIYRAWIYIEAIYIERERLCL